MGNVRSGFCETERDRLAGQLAALAHPARLRIMEHLAGASACCCGDVVSRLDLAQSTVSQHLRILVAAGLVRYTPEGQRSRYSVDRAALRALRDRFAVFAGECCTNENRDCGGPAAVALD